MEQFDQSQIQDIIESKEGNEAKRRRLDPEIESKFKWTVTHNNPSLPPPDNLMKMLMNGVCISLSQQDLNSIYVYEMSFEGEIKSSHALRYLAFKVSIALGKNDFLCVGEGGELYSLQSLEGGDIGGDESEVESEDEDEGEVFVQLKLSEQERSHLFISDTPSPEYLSILIKLRGYLNEWDAPWFVSSMFSKRMEEETLEFSNSFPAIFGNLPPLRTPSHLRNSILHHPPTSGPPFPCHLMFDASSYDQTGQEIHLFFPSSLPLVDIAAQERREEAIRRERENGQNEGQPGEEGKSSYSGSEEVEEGDLLRGISMIESEARGEGDEVKFEKEGYSTNPNPFIAVECYELSSFVGEETRNMNGCQVVSILDFSPLCLLANFVPLTHFESHYGLFNIMKWMSGMKVVNIDLVNNTTLDSPDSIKDHIMVIQDFRAEKALVSIICVPLADFGDGETVCQSIPLRSLCLIPQIVNRKACKHMPSEIRTEIEIIESKDITIFTSKVNDFFQEAMETSLFTNFSISSKIQFASPVLPLSHVQVPKLPLPSVIVNGGKGGEFGLRKARRNPTNCRMLDTIRSIQAISIGKGGKDVVGSLITTESKEQDGFDSKSVTSSDKRVPINDGEKIKWMILSLCPDSQQDKDHGLAQGNLALLEVVVKENMYKLGFNKSQLDDADVIILNEPIQIILSPEKYGMNTSFVVCVVGDKERDAGLCCQLSRYCSCRLGIEVFFVSRKFVKTLNKREDLSNIYELIVRMNYQMGGTNWFVGAYYSSQRSELEALGLIKFDEINKHLRFPSFSGEYSGNSDPSSREYRESQVNSFSWQKMGFIGISSFFSVSRSQIIYTSFVRYPGFRKHAISPSFNHILVNSLDFINEFHYEKEFDNGGIVLFIDEDSIPFQVFGILGL